MRICYQVSSGKELLKKIASLSHSVLDSALRLPAVLAAHMKLDRLAASKVAFRAPAFSNTLPHSLRDASEDD